MQSLLLMPLLLTGFFGAELLATTVKRSDLRKVLHLSSFISNCLLIGVLFFFMPVGYGTVLSALFFYRIVNNLRVIKGSPRIEHYKRDANRTSIFLMLLQTIVLTVFILPIRGGYTLALKTAVFASLMVAVICSVTIIRALIKTKALKLTERAEDLPSVSVCIPARNETLDLANCLNTLLSSDYPKLEIVVLDDCSHDTTAEVIRDFSRAGVRFIQGKTPPNGWLGKNHAYQKLLDAAQGKLILFCGVDVRFETKTVMSAVSTLLSRSKKMISVMPRQKTKVSYGTFIQPMRYWWELALPRRLFNRPAVLSTFWLIEKASLEKLGGFKAVKNSVTPEHHFARQLARQDSYSFLRSGDSLPVFSDKSLPSQTDTAERLRYPQLGRRPELVALLTLLELVGFIMPFILVPTGIFVELGIIWTVALATCLVLLLNHGLITRAWNRNTWPLDTIIFPFSVLYNLLLTNISMFKYEFGKVIWRERNICIPVMQVYPELPKI